MIGEKNEWFDIPDFDKYEITNFGIIRNKKTKKILKQAVDRGGYNQIVLHCNDWKKLKRFRVHRLVAIVFLLNLECKEFVIHKLPPKTNNDVNNLMWCTRIEAIEYNRNYMFRSYEYMSREKNPRAKLNIRKVKLIRSMCRVGGYTHKRISKIFNISEATVWNIKHNNIWKGIH